MQVYRGLRTEITTNGSLLTVDRVRNLVDAGLDRPTISLQRFGEAKHAARRAPVSFDRYYQRILSAVQQIDATAGRTEAWVLLMNNSTGRFFDIDVPMGIAWDRNGFHKQLSTVL